MDKVVCGGFRLGPGLRIEDGVLMLDQQEGGNGEYIEKVDGTGTGSTNLQSLVVTEEVSARSVFAAEGFRANGARITEVGDPTELTDAVNLKYVNGLDGIGPATVDTYGTVKAFNFNGPNDVTNENVASMLQLLISALINAGIIVEV